MTLARHSDPKLTMAVYGKLEAGRIWEQAARRLQLPAAANVRRPATPRGMYLGMYLNLYLRLIAAADG